MRCSQAGGPAAGPSPHQCARRLAQRQGAGGSTRFPCTVGGLSPLRRHSWGCRDLIPRPVRRSVRPAVSGRPVSGHLTCRTTSSVADSAASQHQGSLLVVGRAECLGVGSSFPERHPLDTRTGLVRRCDHQTMVPEHGRPLPREPGPLLLRAGDSGSQPSDGVSTAQLSTCLVLRGGGRKGSCDDPSDGLQGLAETPTQSGAGQWRAVTGVENSGCVRVCTPTGGGPVSPVRLCLPFRPRLFP